MRGSATNNAPNATAGPRVSGQLTLALERAQEGSARAARGWTDLERAHVDAALERLVARGRPFTADAVWAELPPGFPVTKGLAGRLSALRRRGVIGATGEYAVAARRGEHDHAQRLTVWRPVPAEMRGR